MTACRPTTRRKPQQAEPKTVPELLDRGLTLYDQKDFNGAIAAFSEAIRLDPKSAQAYAYRAQAWGAKHYRDREIADLDHAIRLDPKNASYRVSRAGSWSSQGRHEQAMADYDDAIRLEPNNPTLYVARGNEWRRHVKLDLALADYNRAIQLDPNYIHAYICRALHHEATAGFRPGGRRAFRNHPDGSRQRRGPSDSRPDPGHL